MKSLYKIFTIFTLLFTISMTAQYSQRNIAWVHGLGENANAWKHYEQIFTQERSLNSMRTNQPTATGLDTATTDLESDMNVHYGYLQAKNSQNIGIGHSMGGLMIRNSDMNNPNQNDKYFGGYITVSTPNYGAGIANSVLNGDVQLAGNDACDKLTAGPEASLLGSVISIIANVTNNDLCDLFINNQITDAIAQQSSQQATQDLKRGSQIITDINNYTNNYNHNIPRISIWGEENSPVHWRLLNSVDGIGFNVLNAASTARDIYQVFHIFYKVLGYSCAIGGFWNPYCWGVSASSFYKARQWKKGRNWFDNSENIWNGLIQTTRIETHTYIDYVWIPCPYPPIDDIDPFNGRNIAPDPDCGSWGYQQVTTNVAVNYPSDGFIPKYSQIMQNNPTPNNTYRVNKANHIEILDMSSSSQGDITKQKLKDIFIRPQGDFFRTD